MRIAIIGNCQAQMLEGLFLCTNRFKISRLPPVFQMRVSSKAHTLETLLAADLIFAQRVSNDYPLEWTRSSFLKNMFGDRCLIWPNIYFDGYFPDTQYVYLSRWGKLQGPLDDYHIDSIIRAFRAGMSVEAATARFGQLRDENARPFESSIQQLQAREEDCDVTISDHVEKVVFERQCFYSPNHPDNALLRMMAERLAIAAGIEFDHDAAEKWQYRLDRVTIPPFAPVVDLYHLGFVAPRAEGAYVCRGLKVCNAGPHFVRLGEQRDYLVPDLVEQFFRIYDIALPREPKGTLA